MDELVFEVREMLAEITAAQHPDVAAALLEGVLDGDRSFAVLSVLEALARDGADAARIRDAEQLMVAVSRTAPTHDLVRAACRIAQDLSGAAATELDEQWRAAAAMAVADGRENVFPVGPADEVPLLLGTDGRAVPSVSAGPDAAGPDAAGPDAAGPDAAGPEAGRPEAGRPEAGRAEAGRAEAGRAGYEDRPDVARGRAASDVDPPGFGDLETLQSDGAARVPRSSGAATGRFGRSSRAGGATATTDRRATSPVGGAGHGLRGTGPGGGGTSVGGRVFLARRPARAEAGRGPPGGPRRCGTARVRPPPRRRLSRAAPTHAR